MLQPRNEQDFLKHNCVASHYRTRFNLLLGNQY